MKKEDWFFGYGSLIFDPIYKGQRLENWCEPPVDGTIDKGVEFLHSSSTRGGAPTLCFDGTKRKTLGKVWRALGQENIKGALSYIKRREGKIKKIKVKLADSREIIFVKLRASGELISESKEGHSFDQASEELV